MPKGWKSRTFVVERLAQHFRDKGLEAITGIKKRDVKQLGISDSLCGMDLLVLGDDEEWRINAQSDTGRDMGDDFDIVLGQLLRKMDSEGPRYAIAMPATVNCKKQVSKLPEWIKNRLRLRWFWVDEYGKVADGDPSISNAPLGYLLAKAREQRQRDQDEAERMYLGEANTFYSEYQNVLNDLVAYHSANRGKYDYVFCDSFVPFLSNPLTPEVKKADEEGILLIGKSRFYLRRGKDDPVEWRAKQVNMTAVVGNKCEIAIDVYRDVTELERARGDDISIELENQGLLENENRVLEYLAQEMLKQREFGFYGDASISTMRKGSEWLVEDDATRYYIKTKGGKLNVYEKSGFSIIPQCKYMMASKFDMMAFKFDNKTDMWFDVSESCFFILNSEEPSVDHPGPKLYKVNNCTVIECYTREFADILKKLSRILSK